ncbi:MAG: hypothetical protein QM754_15125 [Tepidisphaeraceae bacterium]
MNALRRTLLGGLFASAQRNVFRGVNGLRLFEIDRTFSKLPGQWTLAGVTGGQPGPTAWRQSPAVDFFTLKGTLEDAFEAADIRGVDFVAAEQAPFVAGATAAIRLNGNAIGTVGEIDNKLAKIERLSFKLFGFEIDLAAVEAAFDKPVTYTQLNRLPPAVRDLAVVVKNGVAFAEIEKLVRETAGGSLEKLELVDEFKGKQVADGHRSLALRLTFRDAARTLTADEVTAGVDAVVAKLHQALGATLRT